MVIGGWFLGHTSMYPSTCHSPHSSTSTVMYNHSHPLCPTWENMIFIHSSPPLLVDCMMRFFYDDNKRCSWNKKNKRYRSHEAIKRFSLKGNESDFNEAKLIFCHLILPLPPDWPLIKWIRVANLKRCLGKKGLGNCVNIALKWPAVVSLRVSSILKAFL